MSFDCKTPTDVAKIVKENNITQIIVIDKDGFYLGMIHLHDLIKEGISEE